MHFRSGYMFTNNKAMRRHVLPHLTCGVLSSSDIMDTIRRDVTALPGPLFGSQGNFYRERMPTACAL